MVCSHHHPPSLVTPSNTQALTLDHPFTKVPLRRLALTDRHFYKINRKKLTLARQATKILANFCLPWLSQTRRH